MPRPPKCRRICVVPSCTGFVPEGADVQEEGAVILQVDEYEVIRLIDLLELTQEDCARQMEIARTTVTGIYDSARRKLAEALVLGRRLVIAGGNYRVCPGGPACGRRCCRPQASGKEEWTMEKIAATYENGQIFQHFGHTAQFKLYQVEDGKVVSSQVVDTNGSGHGALAGFLLGQGVNALICGGIGGGAQVALAQAGITLYAGVSGDADQAVEALLAGTLAYSDHANCDHHDHADGEACGDHGCGGHEHHHGHDHGCHCHD